MPVQRGRRSQPFNRPTIRRARRPTELFPSTTSESDSSEDELPPLIPQPPAVRSPSPLASNCPTNRPRVVFDYTTPEATTANTLPVPPPATGETSDLSEEELVPPAPATTTTQILALETRYQLNGTNPNTVDASPSPPPLPTFCWFEGRLLDMDGNIAQAPQDAQGRVHYCLLNNGQLQEVSEQGPLFTGHFRLPGETNLQFSERAFQHPDFRRPHNNQDAD